MQIALLAGTGDIGEGLALRLARDTEHEIVVGSRDAEKAATAAAEYADAVASRGGRASIEGVENEVATARGDVVVAAVPPYYLTDTIGAVSHALDAESVLVSPAVGMQRDEAGFRYNRPDAGSVTALAARTAPDDVPVVGAFHNLAAGRLVDLDAEFDWDTVVVGDDQRAKETVMSLAAEIDGLRPLDGGPLANAAEVEALTPLLINVAERNDGLHDLGVAFR
jgi:hypothetical protein